MKADIEKYMDKEYNINPSTKHHAYEYLYKSFIEAMQSFAEQRLREELIDFGCWNNPFSFEEEIKIRVDQFISLNKQSNVCPECGYPKFKKSFEDFERCNGCNWTSK